MATKIIILPGWGGSKKTWASFVSKLAGHVEFVEVIELPCFGSEPCPATVWGVEEYAAFVKKTLDTVGNDCILLGHSFGGQVATYLVATHPEVCKKLILSGAAVYRPKHTLKRTFFGILAKVGKVICKLPLLSRLEPLAKKFLYKAADSPDYSNTAEIQRNIFRKIIRQDVSHLLKNISVPTLIVWGDSDTYTPKKYAYAISKNISDSELHIIKGGRHGLHISSQDSLLATILAFV